uniref:Uncharacterized protein n=1 Tax=Strix occidentalis caurina TaxID=311401 RepID=A0A8D0F5P8_STROC
MPHFTVVPVEDKHRAGPADERLSARAGPGGGSAAPVAAAGAPAMRVDAASSGCAGGAEPGRLGDPPRALPPPLVGSPGRSGERGLRGGDGCYRRSHKLRSPEAIRVRGERLECFQGSAAK